jgi:hypothetical protein
MKIMGSIVGRAMLPADPLSAGPSRLKGGCSQGQGSR